MTVRILHGDCRVVMATLPANSVDAIVTDPPYHLTAGKKGGSGEASVSLATPHGRARVTTGFMGMKWDGGDVAFQPATWAAALRVLKPGGMLVAFGGTRTYHRLVCAIEDGGFEVRDMLAWLYGSGFPKSLDVSKAIDKMGPPGQVRFSEFALHYEARRKALSLTHAQICAVGGWHGAVNHGGTSVNWANGYGMPTVAQWGVLQPLLGLDDRWKQRVEREEFEREKIGEREATTLAVAPGQGTNRVATQLAITAPGSDHARQWEGWGTALKPAHEPICLARKPLEKGLTVASNVLKWGTGALWVDGCRVGTGEDERTINASVGRWPANVLHDGSDEVLAVFPFAPGAVAPVTGDEPTGHGFGGNVYGAPGTQGRQPSDKRDGGGSAARFFWCPKTSRSDRNEGLQGMPEKPLLWSGGEQNPGAFQSANTKRAAQNNHPTVKPTELMRYLVRLVTPPGGMVLDPFMGSGSTLKAAELEGFSAIGIELDADYIDIARRRIAADAPLFAQVEAA